MPTFLVGSDGDGHWLAVEAQGPGGGVFTSQDAAMHYARSQTARWPGAITLSPVPISLPRI